MALCGTSEDTIIVDALRSIAADLNETGETDGGSTYFWMPNAFLMATVVVLPLYSQLRYIFETGNCCLVQCPCSFLIRDLVAQPSLPRHWTGHYHSRPSRLTSRTLESARPYESASLGSGTQSQSGPLQLHLCLCDQCEAFVSLLTLGRDWPQCSWSVQQVPTFPSSAFGTVVPPCLQPTPVQLTVRHEL